MPIMDGWEAVRLMREIQSYNRYQEFKIIAITGFCCTEDKIKCLENGFDYVLNKPATKSKLI